MTNSIKTLVWVIAEFVLVFVLLSLPGNEFNDHSSWISKIMALPFADKVVHMGLFGSLALSLFFHLELLTDERYKSTRAKAIALIICILYGIGMEYYQKYESTDCFAKQKLKELKSLYSFTKAFHGDLCSFVILDNLYVYFGNKRCFVAKKS